MSPAPQGNYAASVLTDCPAQSATPRLLRRPTPGLKPDAGRRSRACVRVRMRKGGNFEKPPVSSTQIGIMRRRDFARQPRGNGELSRRGRLGAHGGTRDSSSDSPPRASRRANPFARSRGQGQSPHVADHLDRNAQDLLQQIKRASMLEKAEAAGEAFRTWAQAQGLLLVPPEDGNRA